MKRLLNRLVNNQGGQALVLVLVVMLAGNLIIAVSLNLMSSGIKIEKNVEQRTEELYAADAGVENAFYFMMSNPTSLPLTPTPVTVPTPNVNSRTFAVTIEMTAQTNIYKITSIATSAHGSKTTIVSYALVFDSLIDNVVTSTGDLSKSLKGDVQPPEKIVYPYPQDMWTQVTEGLAAYYWNEVKNKIPYASDIIDVKDTPFIGPTYTNGDLNIKKTGISGNTLLKLQGPLYVKGNLVTDQNKEFTIDLNGQTIFVENGINIGGSKTTITGSGCIIAVGDIKFLPTVSSSPADFIFVMSINGTITAQPQGGFYGSFAGKVEVQMQPGSTITWSDPSGENLNLPSGWLSGLQIKTWKIRLE